MSWKPTARQVEVTRHVRAAHPNWYRAATSGERVTLASLHRARVLDRQVWRVGKSKADNAHEYRLAERVRCELGLVEPEAQP